MRRQLLVREGREASGLYLGPRRPPKQSSVVSVLANVGYCREGGLPVSGCADLDEQIQERAIILQALLTAFPVQLERRVGISNSVAGSHKAAVGHSCRLNTLATHVLQYLRTCNGMTSAQPHGSA